MESEFRLKNIVLKPNDRIAIVGKTGSGKTSFAITLAGTYARVLPKPWEVWWLDKKGDSKDVESLRKWGFRNALDSKDLATSKIPHAQYWPIRSRKGMPGIAAQAQSIIRLGYEKRHVVIVVDEYTQVVPSRINPGNALLDVFTRGRGLNVGLIGLTQEPVYVPRLLLSQASHQALFSVTYQHDIDYMRKMHKSYYPPSKNGDIHGFYWTWIDGNSDLLYFKHQRAFYESLLIGNRKEKEDG